MTLVCGGTYLAMEGPQFGTLAESRLYREVWGCDVVGMTNKPEARLAREAELCYATVAMVTDYDCWMEDPSRHVSVAGIFELYGKSLEKARSLLGGASTLERLQHADAPLGCFTVVQFLEKIFAARERPHRPGTHREEPVAFDLPARVLRRHARGNRVIRVYADAMAPDL